MVQVDLDRSRLSSDFTQLQLLDLPLHSLVTPAHVHFLLLGLVLSKYAEYVLHHALSVLFLVDLPRLRLYLLQVLHGLAEDVLKEQIGEIVSIEGDQTTCHF